MMTKEKATKAWCPMARAGEYFGENGTISVNRTERGRPDEDCLCIADRCAAWRWMLYSHAEMAGAERLNDHPLDVGYCGLAGRPVVP